MFFETRKETKMKRKKLLTNLCLVFSMLFCIAFACNDGGEKRDASDGDVPETARNSSTDGLPNGNYACFTTVSTYAGQGGSGRNTYPVYNFSRQTRGVIHVKSDGTYLVGDSRCHYSYDPTTKNIQWQDCPFAGASSSELTTDDEGGDQILVKFSNDRDVWACTRQ